MALLKKVSTTQDGGYTISLTVGNNEREEIKKLLDVRDNHLLSVAIVPRIIDNDFEVKDAQ